MRFTDVFIKRPVFATVLSLMVLALGIVGFEKLPVRQYPKIDASVINISTSYAGADAKLIEGFVTTPIENAIGGVDGIDYIESSSIQGQSDINVHLKLGYNINTAISDVSANVSAIRQLLPKQIDDPVINKQDPNAQPTMYISFASDNISPEGVSDYITRVIEPQLASLSGVGEARILGQRSYAMRLWLNPKRMTANGITANDVYTMLSQNNIQSAPGNLKTTYQIMAITAGTDLKTETQFNNLVVKSVNGKLVRLKDIGHAELASADQTIIPNINGKNRVVVAIIPKSDANPLDVSKAVYHVFPNIKADLPAGMHMNMVWDTSIFIAQSIQEVNHTILIAALCVIAIIFLFIGAFRAVLIPMVTIPLSLIGAFALMAALGYTINTLTLLALVLAIGMVVDDAIVVLENIHRHLEAGMDAFSAAIKGAREIAFAVIAMTLTLAAVYAPIGFTTGLTGSLFTEFAFTLAGTVLISGFIALTLSPMMCAKIMRNLDLHRGYAAFIDKQLERLANAYQRLLRSVLDHKAIVVLIASAILIFGIILFVILSLSTELAPIEDQGALMAFIKAPSSVNVDYTVKHTKAIQAIYDKLPEKEGYGILNGIPSGQSSAISFIVFKDWQQRHRTTAQLKPVLANAMNAIPGIIAAPIDPPSLPGSSGFFSLQVILKTTGTYEHLQQAVQTLLKQARSNHHLIALQTDLEINKPNLSININRNKASDLGVSMQAISESLNVLLAQPKLGYFSMNGRSYNVLPEVLPQFKQSPNDLNLIHVRTNSGHLIPLSNLVTMHTVVEPLSLNHFQQLRSATIQAAIIPGYSLGQAIHYLQHIVKTELPQDISVDYAGDSRTFEQSSSSMAGVFVFALLFIYLVLAAQFESFIDPLIVMFSVLPAIVGALFTIFIMANSSMRGSLNIYTEVGLLTLVGLIAKHGILMTEFANQLQAQGIKKHEAIIQAASIRLRPILMTTAAMIFGAIPLALATGAGAASRGQMGWVIIGGMSFGTLFTLFLVPTAYDLLAKTFNLKAAADKQTKLAKLDADDTH